MIYDVYDVNKHLTGKAVKNIGGLSKGEYLLKSVCWFHNPEGLWLTYRCELQDDWSCYLETEVISGEDGRAAIIRSSLETLGISLDPDKGSLIETFHLLDTEISTLPWLRELYVFECDHLDIVKSDLQIRWISNEELFYRMLSGNVDLGLENFIAQ